MNGDPSDPLSAVVLAAGKGTRFGTTLPKVLQPLAGRPLIGHLIGALGDAGVERIILVVGFGADQVRAAFPDIETALQAEQLGTGHALLQAHSAFAGRAGRILVVNGDLPLLDPGVVRHLVQAQTESGAAMVALSCATGDATGMGRIVRDSQARPMAIVEERVATAEQRAIREWNCGLYLFESGWLWKTIGSLTPSPTGEIFITDLFAIAAQQDQVTVVPTSDPSSAQGVNDRIELARAERVLRERIREQAMRAGVRLVGAETIVIDRDVTIGRDSVILPGSVITGRTRIGERCAIGPQAILDDATIGDDVTIGPAFIQRAQVSSTSVLPPYTVRRDEPG